MNVFKIVGNIEDKYYGAGYALASIANDQIVNLIYLDTVIDDFDHGSIKAALNDARLAPIIRELQATGEVSIGMCSCWEFTEL